MKLYGTPMLGRAFNVSRKLNIFNKHGVLTDDGCGAFVATEAAKNDTTLDIKFDQKIEAHAKNSENSLFLGDKKEVKGERSGAGILVRAWAAELA